MDADFLLLFAFPLGFVGADLMALTKEAAALAVTRIFTQLDSISQDPCAQPVTSQVATEVDPGHQQLTLEESLELAQTLPFKYSRQVLILPTKWTSKVRTSACTDQIARSGPIPVCVGNPLTCVQHVLLIASN
jgi:hypothetical protein